MVSEVLKGKDSTTKEMASLAREGADLVMVAELMVDLV